RPCALGDLRADQQRLARNLLTATLSQKGYRRVMATPAAVEFLPVGQQLPAVRRRRLLGGVLRHAVRYIALDGSPRRPPHDGERHRGPLQHRTHSQLPVLSAVRVPLQTTRPSVPDGDVTDKPFGLPGTATRITTFESPH